MRTDRGEAGWEKTPGTCSLSPAPRGDLLRNGRREFLAVVPVLECDGVKPLRGPADIHTDDEGTGLVLIHTDSRARKESWYMFPLLAWGITAVLLPRRREGRYSSSRA